MVIFIDTNVYVSLLFRSEFIDPYIAGVINKIKSGAIINLLPPVIQSEIVREVNKAADRKVKSLEFNPPPFQRTEEELKIKVERVYKEIKEHLEKSRKELIQTQKKLLNKITKELVPKSQSPEETLNLINLAFSRKGKGFPPGKPGDNIGDQLVWEILLSNFNKENVVIISQDPDWHNHNSNNKKPRLNYLLDLEWKSVSNCKIKIYNSIGDFINGEFGESVKSKTAEIQPDKESKSNLSDLIDIAWSDIPSDYIASKISPLSASGSIPLLSSDIPSGSVSASGFSGASISNIGSVGNLRCKNCGYYLSFGFNFCPSCGLRNN